MVAQSEAQKDLAVVDRPVLWPTQEMVTCLLQALTQEGTLVLTKGTLGMSITCPCLSHPIVWLSQRSQVS